MKSVFSFKTLANAVYHVKHYLRALAYKESNPEFFKVYMKEHFKRLKYDETMLIKDITYIKQFSESGTDLYNRDFLGLRIHESVCAVAVPMSIELKTVRERIKESEFKHHYF